MTVGDALSVAVMVALLTAPPWRFRLLSALIVFPFGLGIGG